MKQFSGVPRKDLTWSPGAVGVWGKRVAAVGGTGGIGQAISRRLAAQGARVTVVGQTFRDEGTKGLKFPQGRPGLDERSAAGWHGRSRPSRPTCGC